jgi:LPXTG-motif cell wall-anchored protein
MKGLAKVWIWPLALAVGLSLGAAQVAGAQPAPATDPVSVAVAFEKAVGTDVDTALALVADDAVLKITPAPQGTSGLWTGKDEVRQALQYSRQHMVNREITGSPQASGNQVTYMAMVSNDFFQMIGVSPVQFSTQVVVEDGKIKSYTSSIVPSEGPRVGAASQAYQAAHGAQAPQAPAGMPRTGDGDSNSMMLMGLAVGMLFMAGGMLVRRVRSQA